MNISKFMRDTNLTEGKPFFVEEPLVVMWRDSDRSINCLIYPRDYKHDAYGLLVCDLVRHIANAFKVHENDVWKWVDKERFHHTTPITFASIGGK
jgi:hypothetical protein